MPSQNFVKGQNGIWGTEVFQRGPGAELRLGRG